MKTLTAISTFLFIYSITITLDKAATDYKIKCLEREFAKRLALQDSIHNVMYDRILKGNYKPKKVK